MTHPTDRRILPHSTSKDGARNSSKPRPVKVRNAGRGMGVDHARFIAMAEPCDTMVSDGPAAVSVKEVKAVRQAIRIGRQLGFGILIYRLRRAWALTLYKGNGVSLHQALVGTGIIPASATLSPGAEATLIRRLRHKGAKR